MQVLSADRESRLPARRLRRPGRLAPLAAALILWSCSADMDESANGNAEIADPAGVVALAEVPIDTDFGLVWIEVSVDGSDPLPFLLDTGFDYSVIDAGVAAALSLTVSDPDTVPQPGGPVEIGLTEGVTLGVPGGDLHDWTLRAIPIAAAAQLVGREFAGIIGTTYWPNACGGSTTRPG